MIAIEINLTITMTYLQLEQQLYTTETFQNKFCKSNRQRKTPTVIRHLLSSPRQPDFAL